MVGQAGARVYSSLEPAGSPGRRGTGGRSAHSLSARMREPTTRPVRGYLTNVILSPPCGGARNGTQAYFVRKADGRVHLPTRPF